MLSYQLLTCFEFATSLSWASVSFSECCRNRELDVVYIMYGCRTFEGMRIHSANEISTSFSAIMIAYAFFIYIFFIKMKGTESSSVVVKAALAA